MKIKISIFFLLLGGFIIQSCEEEMKLQDYFIEPTADIQLSENKIFVFESLTVTNNSEGQQFILYSGAKGSEYDSIETSGAVGIQPNLGKKDFRLSYSLPGEYKVTLLASGFKSNEKETVTSVIQKDLTVTDTAKTIEGIIFERMYGIFRLDRDGIATFKEFSHEPSINGKYMTVEMYSPWNPNVLNPLTYQILGNPKNTKFSPTFDLNSNYINVEIEGLDENIVDETNGTTKVDFSDGVDMYEPKKITIHPYEGEPNEYTLCILQIPQLKSITIGGIGGMITYDLTDSHRFFFDVDAPPATDINNMAVVFENYQDGVVVSSDGEPVSSGDVLPLTRDFTQDGLVYTATLDMYFAQPGYEEIYNISSETVITVTLE